MDFQDHMFVRVPVSVCACVRMRNSAFFTCGKAMSAPPEGTKAAVLAKKATIQRIVHSSCLRPDQQLYAHSPGPEISLKNDGMHWNTLLKGT